MHTAQPNPVRSDSSRALVARVARDEEPELVLLPDGRRMALDRYGGSGPTVLLLHGIPGSRATFARIGASLGRTCRVLVPDLLGFGASDDPPIAAHAKEHAAALVALLDALAIERVHLVGHDFGGPTALHMARALGDRVRSLTLAATNVFPDTKVPGPLRIARVPVLGPLFFWLAFGRLGLMAMWLAAVQDRRALPMRRYLAALRGSGVDTTRRIFLASMRDLPGLYADVERIARSLAVPSLVLWGARDPFFPVAVGERTAAALRAELRVFEGCGHFVPEERASEAATAIEALVRRAP